MTCRLARQRINLPQQRHSIVWRFAVIVTVAAVLEACTSPGQRAAAPPADTSPQSPPQAPPSDRSQTLPPRVDLSLNDRASWRPILKWPDECETAFGASQAGDDAGLEFHELAPRLSIVAVRCAAGSYQSSSTFVRFDERQPPPEATVLEFPVYEAAGGAAFKTVRTTEIWGEVAVDATKPIMTVLNLARQTADCGVWTQYDIGATEPVVVEARAHLPCSARAQPPIRLELDHPPVRWRRLTTER
jgi:hypothetical protein